MSKAVTKEQLADCLERIGDYFVQTNEDFTGATSSADGAKGMVPAPTSSDREKFLRGDGTWAETSGGVNPDAFRKSSTSYAVEDIAYLDTLPTGWFLECTAAGTTDSGTLTIASPVVGNTVTDGAVTWTIRKISSGSGSVGGVALGEVSDTSISSAYGKASLTWTDPQDLVVSNVTIARWAGTRVMRKAGSAPTGKYDGTMVVDSATRDQYKTTEFEDTTVEDGVTYYYSFFPHTYDGVFTNPTTSLTTTIPTRPKATMSIDVDTLTHSMVNDSVTINVTTDSSGQISAESSDSTKVTAAVQGSTITVSCLGTGTATLTISQATDSTHRSPDPIVLNYSGYTAGTISVSPSSLSLDTTTSSGTVAVTYSGAGTVTAESSDTEVATVSLSGTTLTVTGEASGSGTVTVRAVDDTNWTIATATVSVAVSFAPVISSILNDNSWDVISYVAQEGTGDTYWDVGDVKMITLNGKIGDYFTANNLSIGLFILDFNHATNGVAENNIIFGGFKSAVSNGVDIALYDSKLYADTNSAPASGQKAFNMNHWHNNSYYGSNFGGWKGSDLRYDILGATSTAPSQYGSIKTTANVGYDATASTLTSPVADTFLAALPSELRSKIRLWTRHIDAVGNSSNSDANIKATVDAVTLLAEPEIFASRAYANQYEKNHNTRMKYYVNGNSPIKYKYNSTSTAVRWWEGSPYYDYAYYFCNVYTGGTANYDLARNSNGLAPALKV